MQKHIERLFSKIPILGRLENEDLICYEFAKKLQRMTRQGDFNTIWFHVANEFDGTPNPKFGAKLKGLGKLAGVADYIFLWDGGCGAIEFKTPTGRQSQGQKDFQAWCKDHNVLYEVARSADEAFDILKEWGRC